MSTPCAKDLLLVSATFGTAADIVTGFSFGRNSEIVSVQGEGVIGDECHGVKRGKFFVLVDYLSEPHWAVAGSAASLVIVTKKMDGTTNRTYTFATMRTFEFAYEFDRDNPDGARWRQPFIYQGTMASNPLTIS